MTAIAMMKARRELADHYVIDVIRKARGESESLITPEQVEEKRAAIKRRRLVAELRKACEPRLCRDCGQVKPHESYKRSADTCNPCQGLKERARRKAKPDKVAESYLRQQGLEITPEAIAQRVAECQARDLARAKARSPEGRQAQAQRKQAGVARALAHGREHLTDSYIRRLIVVEKGYRPGDEITPERIEAKRQGIAAKRDRRAQRHL